jgi:hypothetical protein
MCFFGSMKAPAMPVMPQRTVVTPRAPAADSDAAQRQADEVRRMAAAQRGSQANLVSDLTASDVTAARPVLNPVKAVYLGQ